MKTPVIQFNHLEQFVAEPLAKGDVVRVVVLEVMESVSSQVPGLRLVSVGVHVRAINSAGYILACYLPVAEIQLFNGRRAGDPTWQQYDVAWVQAKALQERVIAHLQSLAVERGLTVRDAGVIDLGGARPLHATWQSDPDRTASV